MTPAERFTIARVARLATINPDKSPHLVPIVFGLVGDVLYSAVDGKPKRTRNLKRLANIAAEPRVSVLADHYDEDWSLLWWVRADGRCRITDKSDIGEAVLTERYDQYRENPPAGPFLEITVERWTGWSSS